MNDKPTEEVYTVDNFGDIIRWFFRLSPTIVLRVPVFLIVGGITALILLANIPYLIAAVLGITIADPSTGAPQPIVSGIRFGIFIIELGILGSPLFLLPYLWSSSVTFSRSIRAALSIAILPLWLLILAALFYLEAI
jgi:hypothetical protein